MMKIAFLLGSLNLGGAENLVCDTLRNAKSAPFEMILIHRKSGNLQSAFYETGSTCIPCKNKISKPLRFIKELRQILYREGVEVIHTQQRIDAFFAHYATIGTKIKVVDTFHGFDNDYNWWNKFLVRHSRTHSDALIFVSKFESDHYTSHYKIPKDKVHVIYNGIDFSKLKGAQGNSDINFQQTNTLKMAMVGSFGPGRDQFTVCKFLNLLNQKKVPFDFYFIGGKNHDQPELFENCKSYCESNGLANQVHFLGVQKDVFPILKSIDAFIYSTKHDTFGIAVIEAIAMGLPTFVNDWNVMKEITHNGEWATLYNTEDANNLLLKFEDFINNQSSYKENALRIAESVKEEYSIQQFTKNLFILYKNLI